MSKEVLKKRIKGDSGEVHMLKAELYVDGELGTTSKLPNNYTTRKTIFFGNTNYQWASML